MSLLGLPTELLEHIITTTIDAGAKGGFEGIAVSCQPCYSIAKHHLRHYNRVKNFRNLSIGAGDPSTTGALLRVLSSDPNIGEYVESLDLDGELTIVPGSTSVDDAQVGSLLQQESGVYSELFQDVDRDLWMQKMRLDVQYDGDTDALPYGEFQWVVWRTVLLLAFLPNLKQLRLCPDWHWINRTDDRWDCWDVLEKMVLMTRTLPTTGMPLAKLERLLPIGEPEYESRPEPSLSSIAELLALPNLTQVHVLNMKAFDDGYTGIPFYWPFSAHTSNIREVHLEACCMDPAGIGELTKHAPHLRKLKYSHDVKYHGCGYEWELADYFAAIREHRGEDLVELALGWFNYPFRQGSIEGPGISDFTGFRALESLELDSDIPEWGLDASQSLAELLPSTLKRLKLTFGNNGDTKMIENLTNAFAAQEWLRQKATRFPLLDKIDFHYLGDRDSWNELGESGVALEEALKSSGAQVRFSEGRVPISIDGTCTEKGWIATDFDVLRS